MTPEDIKIIRSIIREEIETALTRYFSNNSAPSFNTDRPLILSPDNPYLMDDESLRYAESRLSTEEAKILRIRVMAARLDKAGNKDSARRMYMRAARLEREFKKQTTVSEPETK